MGNKTNKQAHPQGNRVIVENGRPKLVLSEETLKEGYLDIEESRRLILDMIDKIYELNDEEHKD